MKSFENNLKEQFSNLKVRVPDEPRHLEHLYADYVELITLFSDAQSFVTSSDILDRLKDEGTLEQPEDEDQSDTAEYNDVNETWINEIFKIIESRSISFDVDYPFNYINNRLILAESLTLKHKLYIFMLVSSNLHIFSKLRASLTSDFETVCSFVLRNYLPSHAIVKQFGKRSDYIGTAIKKIKDLAVDLKVEVADREMENISAGNTQERGLDLIGWIPFDDGCPNFFTILGQCACGRDWPNKHHDTKRFENYLQFYRLQPVHAMFIPYALIGKSQGKEFYRSDDIEKNTLVFERKRISEFFNNQAEFDKLESMSIVEKCLEYIEDIV